MFNSAKQEVQLEKPVPNNDMYELGYGGWVPQTVGCLIQLCLQ